MDEDIKIFSEMEIQQRSKTIEKAKETISEITPQWEADPNVLTLGYGLRLRKGKIETEIVISFLVKTKEKDIRKIEELGSKPIPEKIRGMPTDVVEIGEMKRQQEATGERGDKAYDPLVGGCGTSNADSHSWFWNGCGTLGSICFDKASGAPMALSNWHVWAEGGEKGDDIIQPGHPRTEDRVHAYFEAAFCGPIANLIEWEAPSALTGVLYGGAAASVLAAAAHDVIDPSRKGQGKTVPSASEVTKKEAIDMKIDYQTQPIPGTPFKLKVNWEYTRHTDKKSYHYHEEEDILNEHVLISKHLRTNKKQYRPGEKVELYALLDSDKPFNCEYYYAVAYLIPLTDESRRIPVILHPSLCSAEKVCIDFSGDKPDTTLPGNFTRLGAEFNSPEGQKFEIYDWYQHDNKGELYLFREGMFIKVPPSSAAEAHIVTFASPVGIKVYSKGQRIGQVISPQQQGVVHTLRFEGDSIDRVEFFGGSEASMLMFCYEPITAVENVETLMHKIAIAPSEHETHKIVIAPSEDEKKRVCCFKGSITLDTKEKPGKWNAYLFVQTINIVPEGTSPEKAAQLIGGIPVSQNMEDATNVKDTDVECGACDIVDFMFEVISPSEGLGRLPFVIAKCAEGLGLFDQECKDKEGKGYPIITDQACKAIDMCGIQAHAGYYMIGSGGKEFAFDIDKYPSLYLTMKAEKATDTCLLLVVHDKEPKDYMRRFVVIGKTPNGNPGCPVGKDCFTIEDDNKWHDYTYDLRKLRGDYPDAETVRLVQFYSGKLCNGIQHAFHFSSLVFKK